MSVSRARGVDVDETPEPGTQARGGGGGGGTHYILGNG